MSVIICPWCQSEIMQEEGQEPDKICPVCDNEISGYRTLKLNIGETDEDEEEDEYEAEEAKDASAAFVADKEDLSWLKEDEESIEDSNDELQQFEETVELLLNEQELVPECPSCHEYMLEVGEQLITANQFRPRVPEGLGEAVIDAPFTLNLYICPACFTTSSFLGDSHRHQTVRRLSQDPSTRNNKELGV